MTITVTDNNVTIESPEMRLVKVRAAIDNCLANGQSYTLFGSHAKSNVSLAELRKMEADLVTEIVRRTYGTSRTVAEIVHV